MSKGIILLDMPENCRDCEYFGLTCKITEEKCNRYNQNGKPDWCPIRTLPKRADHEEYCDNGRYDRGWNDCLNEILKDVNDAYDQGGET